MDFNREGYPSIADTNDMYRYEREEHDLEEQREEDDLEEREEEMLEFEEMEEWKKYKKRKDNWKLKCEMEKEDIRNPLTKKEIDDALTGFDGDCKEIEDAMNGFDSSDNSSTVQPAKFIPEGITPKFKLDIMPAETMPDGMNRRGDKKKI
jgi:hypothetical protein